MGRIKFAVAAGLVFIAWTGFEGRELQVKPATPSSGPAALAMSGAALRDFGRMPLQFIPNRGQVDARVAFYLQGRDKTVYFSPEGLTFALRGTGPGEAGRAAGRYALKLDFLGADPDARPVGEGETGAVVSYFTGSEADWRGGLPTYSKIVYRNLWPGIDLAYFGTPDKLKYEFIVSPGADPALIRLAYRGLSGLSVGRDGGLVVETPAGGFEDDPPLGYQEIDGRRVAVPLAYRIDAAAEPVAGSGPFAAAEGALAYGFDVGSHDPSRPLVLDPAVRVTCGYIGGASLDEAEGIAVDKNGNAYLAGGTFSVGASFPVKAGPDLSWNGGQDAFVAKVNASGTGLVYCGYIGGANSDYARGIAVDASGSAYVVGSTSSDEHSFPVKFGPGLTHKGNDDVFVAKVNASGTGLVYCGYIGGAKGDDGRAIAVDTSGNAYIAGRTESTEKSFPVAVGPDLTFNGGWHDGYVAKVSASGWKLVYCGYIGGDSNEGVSAIAVDGSGSAYVAGWTESHAGTTFPVKGGPDLTPNGFLDAFVAKVNAGGNRLAYCGYIGGAAEDEGNAIAVDGWGNAYVGGSTRSAQAGGFPVKNGPDLTHNGGWDAFVAKVSSSGRALVYCGYLGGRGDDSCSGIARDRNNNIYLTGRTYFNPRQSFPVRNGPDSTHNGVYDAYVAKLNAAGSSLVYCGYIGGAAEDEGNAIAVDGSGNAYIAGSTMSSEATFPVKGGPDLSWNGNADGFVVKIRLARALGRKR